MYTAGLKPSATAKENAEPVLIYKPFRLPCEIRSKSRDFFHKRMAFSSPNFASCNPPLSSKGRYIAIDSQNPSSEISIVEIKRSAESDCRFLAVKAVLRDRDFNGKETTFEIRSTLQSGGGDVAAEKKDSDIADLNSFADIDDGGCNGDCNSGNGRFRRGGGGDGDGDGRDDSEEEEFGVLLKSDEVIREAEARGLSLPRDMLEAAKAIGIRKDLLLRYFDLQDSGWPLGFAIKSCAFLRDRMLADPSFLFKIGTEVVIDSCCATFAEVQKRGKDFWVEFELYVADLLVGVVVDIALVGLLAPYVRIGKPSVSKGFFGRVQQTCGALPSSVFEVERPGCRFSFAQRVGTYFYKGVLYGSVGFVCGLIGQGIANVIMNAKRSIKRSDEDIPVPPLVKSAALWGIFLAVSSNVRYQIINGLERLVEASPMAKRVPPVALAFTIGIRFANNIYGGMQFVDWARWSGVQ